MNKFIEKIKSPFEGKIFISLNRKKEKKEKVKKNKGKVWGIVAVSILSLVSIGTGTTLGIIEANRRNKTPNVDKVVVQEGEKINRRLFLISNDKYTIPVTVSIDKKSSLHEELKDVFDLLKESTPYSNDYVKGYINNDVVVNKMVLENKNFMIDVNEKILETSYDLYKTFEALNQSFLQYEEIDTVSITIDNKNLDTFDQVKNVNQYMKTKTINDNNYYLSNRLGKKEVVFYEREYKQDVKYIVPVTVYVDEKESEAQAFVDATKVGQPLSSRLKRLSTYDLLEANQCENNFKFSITDRALDEDGLVSKGLYDLVSLSLDFMDVDTSVSFMIDNNEVAVSGILEEGEFPVSSIVYNEVKL